MHQHEPFFSFTVPTNEPSTSENRSDDHTLLSISHKDDLAHTHTQLDHDIVTRIDQSTLTRSSPSGSLSPAALPGRPNTANQFAFNFPSASNTEVEEQTPTAPPDELSPLPTAFATVPEPARRNSRHNLTIVTSTNPKPNGRASFSGPVPPPPSNTENVNGQPESPAGYSNLDIGTHNTRPMTAPGAGWAGGNYNHGYDYTSASAGLFGNGGGFI
ncbi:hypothetical protein CROQUDRAFT_536511 [Cronartium quercuum f. sp. fusiforme G11]|uniref:Uncharacterized protein n=1 Tax=Cronartium quercuum f. sp. fusiforme G11 TaxID=708437 RepID=A0A9P6NI79_9BASI|nr:hypothetical protein CROQUDRAFT_536511 [Cronartium quercuum f. sp. fusiforme G11]